MLDLEHGSTMPIFDAHTDIQPESVLSPDRSSIASPSSFGIKFWQCEDGISHYDPEGSVGPCSVRISADEQKIICGFRDGTIVILDSHTGECMETIDTDCQVDWMDISRTSSLIIASSYEDSQLRLLDYCNPKFNATAHTDVKYPQARFSVDGSEFIVSPDSWMSRGEDSLFMERWEISQSPLGLRCLGREPYDPDQRLTEPSTELSHRISEDDQWVVDRDRRRVCWVPPEWRAWWWGDVSESKFVVRLSEGMLIVELPNVRS